MAARESRLDRTRASPIVGSSALADRPGRERNDKRDALTHQEDEITGPQDESIRKLVRDRYATVAGKASAGSGQCGTSCCSPQTDDLKGPPLYAATETDGLPQEAVVASAGCGNPTALASLKPGETVLDLGSGGGIDCFLAAREVGPQGKVIGVDMTPRWWTWRAQISARNMRPGANTTRLRTH